MKNHSIWAIACSALLAACGGQPTEKDFINAFGEYATSIENKESITLSHVQNITVADSVAFISHSLNNEYQDLLAEKKLVWEKKLEDCEKDEKANILRHKDYMKKYETAKRQYGNDIKHKNKIEGYLKAAQKLPSTHEEYLKFDRSRSYSFTRDAENLQAEYEQFLALTLDGYAAQHPYVQAYSERKSDEVLATVYNINYLNNNGESISENYIFGLDPVAVIEQLCDENTHILNYTTVAQ